MLCCKHMQQQKQSTLASLWRFLRPEPEELIFYLLIIFGMIGYAAYRVAIQGLSGAESYDIVTSITTAKETLFGFFNTNDSWGRFFLFGFWFLIGTVTYVIAWSIITLIVDITHDVEVSSSFVHPKSFHQSDFWLSVLSRMVLRAAAGIALVFYGVFWVAAFAPVWLASFQSLFSSGGFTSTHIADSAAALLGVALTLHLAAILLRLMLLRAHYSYED